MRSKQHKGIQTPPLAGVSGMGYQPQKSKRVFKIIITITGASLLVIGSGLLGYWWALKSTQPKLDQLNAHIEDTNGQKAKLENSLNEVQAELDELKISTKNQPSAGGKPSTDLLANIQDSVKSGNISALESYMSSTVTVVIAASEGPGQRTPAQAISDIDHIRPLASEWDFALLDSTLTKWRSGHYAQYFPAHAVIGRSTNNQVITFDFDTAGKKITTIFMANDIDL